MKPRECVINLNHGCTLWSTTTRETTLPPARKSTFVSPENGGFDGAHSLSVRLLRLLRFRLFHAIQIGNREGIPSCVRGAQNAQSRLWLTENNEQSGRFPLLTLRYRIGERSRDPFTRGCRRNALGIVQRHLLGNCHGEEQQREQG